MTSQVSQCAPLTHHAIMPTRLPTTWNTKESGLKIFDSGMLLLIVVLAIGTYLGPPLGERCKTPIYVTNTIIAGLFIVYSLYMYWIYRTQYCHPSMDKRKPPIRGKLVVVEGIHGSGKSTLVQNLSTKLGNTLVKTVHIECHPKPKTGLIDTLGWIEDKLSSGVCVISDRYIHSVLFAENRSATYTKDVIENAPEADFLFLLSVDKDVALNRLEHRILEKTRYLTTHYNGMPLFANIRHNSAVDAANTRMINRLHRENDRLYSCYETNSKSYIVIPASGTEYSVITTVTKILSSKTLGQRNRISLSEMRLVFALWILGLHWIVYLFLTK